MQSSDLIFNLALLMWRKDASKIKGKHEHMGKKPHLLG